jgi:hypothetical protein
VGYPLSVVGADRALLGHSSVFGVVNVIWGAGFLLGPAAGAAIASAGSDQIAYLVLVLISLLSANYVRGLALD